MAAMPNRSVLARARDAGRTRRGGGAAWRATRNAGRHRWRSEVQLGLLLLRRRLRLRRPSPPSQASLVSARAPAAPAFRQASAASPSQRAPAFFVGRRGLLRLARQRRVRQVGIERLERGRRRRLRLGRLGLGLGRHGGLGRLGLGRCWLGGLDGGLGRRLRLGCRWCLRRGGGACSGWASCG